MPLPLSPDADVSAAECHARAAATEIVDSVEARGAGLDTVDGAAEALRLIADRARDLPLPGSGRTLQRWAAVSAVTGVDVTLGRLFEAHADALAILAELGGPQPEPGQRWAVWAAEGPAATVRAEPAGDGWRLSGAKPWCSGAIGCTHALVTADCADGRALFAVALQDAVVVDRESWRATALTGTATYGVTFDNAPAERVGAPGDYLRRPGFWHGGAGVAAAWWGGARGIAQQVLDRAAAEEPDPFVLAHLGALDVALTGCAALLGETARAIDRQPDAPPAERERAALRVRAAAEQAATVAVERTGRALGPSPLSHDRRHARRVADLALYVRQSHAERDLARVGELLAAAP